MANALLRIFPPCIEPQTCRKSHEPRSCVLLKAGKRRERGRAHAKRENITVITVTQRASLLNSVDKVLLLSNGTVAMFGHRQDVLKALAGHMPTRSGAAPVAVQGGGPAQ